MAYESAHDLPSLVELSKQLKGLKLLRFLLPKNQRSELKKLEAQIKEMGDTVDDFYKLLGDRHWCKSPQFEVRFSSQSMSPSSPTDRNISHLRLFGGLLGQRLVHRYWLSSLAVMRAEKRQNKLQKLLLKPFYTAPFPPSTTINIGGGGPDQVCSHPRTVIDL